MLEVARCGRSPVGLNRGGLWLVDSVMPQALRAFAARLGVFAGLVNESQALGRDVCEPSEPYWSRTRQ